MINSASTGKPELGTAQPQVVFIRIACAALPQMATLIFSYEYINPIFIEMAPFEFRKPNKKQRNPE